MRPYRHAPTPSPNRIGNAGSGFASSGQYRSSAAAARERRFNDGYRAQLTAARWLSPRKINHYKPLQQVADLSGTDLAHYPTQGNGTQRTMLVNVIARESYEMNPVALLTPTYGRDLELCTLLCESVDRHVISFSKHYLLVPDCDLPLFVHLASERRTVIPASAFLPDWLRPLPRIIQRKRRQFWWSLRAKPVSGWHVQQFLKIAATISLPHHRYCILDSDVVFFRDFDLTRFECPHSIPLLTMANAVIAEQPRHSRWVETSHQLLGYPTPPLPASDFIGHIIFWDQQTTRALTSRIEDVTGLDWIDALCKTREFSEYMLYGYFVQNDAACSAVHSAVPTTPCVSYWEQPTLSKGELNQLLQGADRHDVAFSIASFSGTPVETIRAAIAESDAILAPVAATNEPAGLAALC
jgi:Family of unknown function (DUF6492)